MSMACPQCKKENPNNINYCWHCGRALSLYARNKNLEKSKKLEEANEKNLTLQKKLLEFQKNKNGITELQETIKSLSNELKTNKEHRDNINNEELTMPLIILSVILVVIIIFVIINFSMS